MDDRCPICSLTAEDLQHVLRDCPFTLQLWHQVVPPELWRSFRTLPFDKWLRWNLKARGGSQQAEEWRQCFVVFCWWLWRRRNIAVFEGEKVSSNVQVIANVSAMMLTLKDARTRISLVNGKRLLPRSLVQKWQAPPPGWIKVNSDGAFSYSSPGIASGGVLRNELGDLLQAFMFKGGEGDCLSAEMWGCIHGLKIAWDLGFRNAILEVDSVDVVALCKSPVIDTHEDRRLAEEMKNLLERDWNVEVILISRWANTAADHLAKETLSALPGLHVFLHTDVTLKRILEADIS